MALGGGVLIRTWPRPEEQDRDSFITPEEILEQADSVLRLHLENTGSQDVSTSIQAAIDEMESNGGGFIDLGRGVFKAGGLITDDHCVTLVGHGAGGFENSITETIATPATRLIAPNSSPIVTFDSAEGQYPKNGGGLRGIMLDGLNAASECLKILSRRNMLFEDVFCFRATAHMIFMSTTGHSLAATPTDVQKCFFRNVHTSARNAPGNTAYALRMRSDDGVGNCSFNEFHSCGFNTQQQVAILMEGSDSNGFYNCTTGHVAGSDYGLVLESDDGGFGYARHNTFFNFGPQAGVRCRSSQLSGNSSHDNAFVAYSRANNIPLPVIEAVSAGAASPATWWGSDTFGLVRANKVVLADGITAPSTESGYVSEYIDTSDGDLKAKFGDGFVRVIGADS